MRRMASFLGRRLGGGFQLCPEGAGPRESASWVSRSSASFTSLFPLCSEEGLELHSEGGPDFSGHEVQIQAAPPSTSFRGGGMRGTACACVAAAVLAACLLVSCCGFAACRWAVWGGVCVVALSLTSLSCAGWISGQMMRSRSCWIARPVERLWAATGWSFGLQTWVLGACVCVCPQLPAGWPDCGCMRIWVYGYPLDPCFACAWRVGVCACVCGWACFVVRAGCSLRCVVARVCGVEAAPGSFQAQGSRLKWARGPVRVYVWA